jgi:cell fate regulator YaaT (PSP1 superfamily)
MAKVAGIRLKRAEPVCYFDPTELELEVDDQVVVETEHGLAIGRVVIAPKQVIASELTEPLKPVLRKASAEDLQQVEELKVKGKEALAKCSELVAKHSLSMKPLSAEYNLDGSHLTIYFSAEKRIDFRTLLRELGAALKTRVELRQVGARDAARLIGGLGKCGRPLCCITHLHKLEPISVRMARDQGLPLNPDKLSGVCNRLLCCLSFEEEQYLAMKQKLPQIGDNVDTPHGRAKVIESNPIKEIVTVQLESEATLELPLSQIQGHKKEQ